MKLTKHAMKQAQRRGIEPEAIDLVLSYGEDIQAARGCRIYRLPYRELQYLAEECPLMLWQRYRDRLRRLAVVVDPAAQSVVTAMHRDKAIWKQFKRRRA